MTGRGRGFCAGYNSPGYSNAGFGRGFGFRRRAWPVNNREFEENNRID
jgi:hypothetical protein